MFRYAVWTVCITGEKPLQELLNKDIEILQKNMPNFELINISYYKNYAVIMYKH